MDSQESQEGPTSITESSQEWHILNLLRVSERDLFETNLQEFRKIQLTESQDGKVRLCKLVNEILRLDPQYSIILIEDLSHLFNDSNHVVQKFALISLVDSFNILFSHILASNAVVEGYSRYGHFDPLLKNQITRCRKSVNLNHSHRNSSYNNYYAVNGSKEHEFVSQELDDYLPFTLDNARVFESFADLACIRFMVHTRLLDRDFSELKFKSVHSLPSLIYTRTGYYSVNLLKLLFYELANYPNYLCNQCFKNNQEPTPTDKVKKDVKSNKGKETKGKKSKSSKHENIGFDLYGTLYTWHSESVKLLQVLVTKYLNGSKKSGKSTKDKESSKSAKETKNKGNESKHEDYIVPSVLSAEVACCLISFYPDFYFDTFIDFLVPLLSTSHYRVFETLIFRLFSSNQCYKYHHVLLEKVNKYGYDLELNQVYKIVQTLPSRFHDTYRGTMVVVDTNQSGDKDKKFDFTDKLVSTLSVELDEKMKMFPAAQLFEFDKELVKNYKKIKNSQIKISNNFYKLKPVEVTPIQYPSTNLEQTTTNKNFKHKEHEGKSDSFEDYSGLERPTKDLKIVEDSVIKENESLFLRLVGCQMLDTVASYQRFLRFEVVAPKLPNFDKFANLVLKKFLVSNLVEFEKRKHVMCNLLNYLAEHTMVNHADPYFFRNNKHFDEKSYGLETLFSYVIHVNNVEIFTKYLKNLNNFIIYSYTTNLAKSLATYRSDKGKRVKDEVKVFERDDNYMEHYENFVNLSLSYMCKTLSDLEDFGDLLVHSLSKFVLNLPKVPNKIADLIVFWVNSDKEGNLKLAFSLVSNLLKLSASTSSVDFTKLLGTDYYKYTSNLLFVKRSIFMVFLVCLTNTKAHVSNLFLKLLSSPKGLYNNTYNYTLKSQQALHDDLVEKLNELKNNSDGNTERTDLYDDCQYMSDRPLWQWPKKLVDLLKQNSEFESLKELSSEPTTEESLEEEVERDTMYYYDEDEQNVNDDVGTWIEESVTLMSGSGTLKTTKFINDSVKKLLKLTQKTDPSDKSIDKDTKKLENVQASPHELPRESDDDNMEVDDGSDDGLVVVDEESVEEENKFLLLEPILACCLKNSRLVFMLSTLANSYVGTQFYLKCSKTVSNYPRELQILIKYTDGYSPFVESVLEETRKNWCNVLFKFDERTTLEKNLMMLLLSKMETTPEYVIQMAPFLSPEQLNKLMLFLFHNYEKDKMVKILDVIIETPKISLPQHFLYSTYNLPVSAASSTDKERDYMKLQVTLLDICIMYCTLGKFSVEYAISSLYLIVESFDNINFVFGRLLCQFVQKVPLTRKVIVDVIFPKLIQKQCWQDKQLFKGVVITICTLWNQFKDHLLRYILEMPNSNVKMVLKALHGQHNIADYLKTVSLPSNIQSILQEVLSTPPATTK